MPSLRSSGPMLRERQRGRQIVGLQLQRLFERCLRARLRRRRRFAGGRWPVASRAGSVVLEQILAARSGRRRDSVRATAAIAARGLRRRAALRALSPVRSRGSARHRRACRTATSSDALNCAARSEFGENCCHNWRPPARPSGLCAAMRDFRRALREARIVRVARERQISLVSRRRLIALQRDFRRQHLEHDLAGQRRHPANPAIPCRVGGAVEQVAALAADWSSVRRRESAQASARAGASASAATRRTRTAAPSMPASGHRRAARACASAACASKTASRRTSSWKSDQCFGRL